jgi:hypothetical protein
MNQSVSHVLDESRHAGRELAITFASGAQPKPVHVGLSLYPGEFCVGFIAGLVLQWLDNDVEYTKKSGGYMLGGGGVGIAYNATRLTSNLLGNGIRKARARHQAAFRWRTVDQGNIFITNRRFAIQGAAQWIDLWYEDIRMADCNGQAIELQISGVPRTALQIWPPDYWFVMFNKLAYDRVFLPPAASGQAYKEWTEDDRASDPATDASG